MPDNDLTYDDLLKVLDLLKASAPFSELRVKMGDLEISLRRGEAGPGEAPPPRALNRP